MSLEWSPPAENNMFVSHDESIEVAPETYFQSIFSGVTAFDTDDGIVLVDSGPRSAGAELADLLRERTDSPIHTAIYTHGHWDHPHGLDAFVLDDQEPPNVIAHEAIMDRFARYEYTEEHNEAINTRQMDQTVPGEESSAAELFPGAEGEVDFAYPEYLPTTLYTDQLTLSVGDVTFEITHARGETDDHSWVYCPDRDVLCTGDFFINVAPNDGSPTKVQRYPWERSQALREMAALDPATMCPGHGEAVVDDPEKVRRMLLTTADYLDSIVKQTITALNDESPPHVDIIHEIDPPEIDEPWLQIQHDEPEYVARNVIRYYGGWWSGRPSELKPSPRDELASEIEALVGGTDVLLDRAEALFEAGDARLAGHLADYALEAAPDDDAVQRRVAELYERRADDQESFVSHNFFAAAAAYASRGRPFR